MINKELDKLLDSDEEDEEVGDVKLDINKIKENAHLYSNEKLCEMIVCDRYLGFGKTVSVFCMEELAKRRLAGDTFNFESHISEIHKELPVLDFSMPDIREVLNQAIGKKFGNR